MTDVQSAGVKKQSKRGSLRHRKILLTALLATAAILCFAILVASHPDKIPLAKEELEKLNFVGAFAAGIANVAAIVWLCATMTQQQNDLSAQLGQLSLQRESIDLLSKAVQAQFTRQVYEATLSSLSHDVRTMIMLALGSEADELVSNTDRSFFFGDKEAYLRVFLENHVAQDSVTRAIVSSNPIISHYAFRFLKRSDEIRVSLIVDEKLSHLMTVMYNASLIGQSRDLISISLTKRTSGSSL